MAYEYNMNYSGKSMIDKQKRARQSAGEYLAEDKRAREDAEIQRLQETNDAIMKGAQYSSTSAYSRNKEKARLLQESLKYRDKTTKNAMTEYICQIVESALLIDKDEYAQLNPNYKEETRALVRDLLEQADLNESIKNKDTLAIMEHISRTMPMVETGILLEDEKVTQMIISNAENNKINDSIEDLTNNIEDKVADIVSKEQEIKADLESNVNQIIEIAEAAKANAREAAGLDAEEAEPEVDENGNPIEEPAEGDVEVDENGNPIEPEVDENGNPIEAKPEEDMEEIPAEEPTPEMIPDAKPKTTINIKPDGTVKIVQESALIVSEIPKTGLLETFAVNEGLKMVEAGQPYNGDLALAKALNYITVLETFDCMGLLNVDANKEAELVKLGGGIPDPKPLMTDVTKLVPPPADTISDYTEDDDAKVLAGANPDVMPEDRLEEFFCQKIMDCEIQSLSEGKTWVKIKGAVGKAKRSITSAAIGLLPEKRLNEILDKAYTKVKSINVAKEDKEANKRKDAVLKKLSDAKKASKAEKKSVIREYIKMAPQKAVTDADKQIAEAVKKQSKSKKAGEKAAVAESAIYNSIYASAGMKPLNEGVFDDVTNTYNSALSNAASDLNNATATITYGEYTSGLASAASSAGLKWGLIGAAIGVAVGVIITLIVISITKYVSHNVGKNASYDIY